MKLTRDEQRARVWDSLYRAGGDREKAAEAMEVSQRTLARYITELDLHADMEKMGWKRNAGPPPGMARGSSIIRMMVLGHLKKYCKSGIIDYGRLSVEVYGVDDPPRRNRLYAILEDLKNSGHIAYDGEKWRVLDKALG